MTVSAVLLAGGQGDRFGATVPKALMSLNGKPVIQHALDHIESHVDEVIVVAAEPYRHYRHVPAGATRGRSAHNGALAAQGDKVLIHDAVRPFLTDRIVRSVVAAVDRHSVVDTAVPIVDGYLRGGIPMPKHDRWIGQTPEAFDRATLLRAFAAADREYDDEVGMVWATLGIAPYIVEGISLNTKITFAKDLENAEGILRFWHEPLTAPPKLAGPVLVLGGSGGIGTAILNRLPGAAAPTRTQVDLAGPFTVDLSGYTAVVHVAGAYEADIMAVNFGSVLRLADQAIDQGWTGNIVVFSSTAGSYGRRGIPVYSASKAALNTWIEASHEDLAAVGIYLNGIAPAKVDTRLQRTINPDADPALMLSPDYVATRTLPYLDTTVHGHIVQLRVGFDR